MVSVDKTRHLGDVYLNGLSFYESESYDTIVNPDLVTEFIDDWTQRQTPVINPEQTKFRWYVESDENNTTIYANFQDANPNDELVEINVRQNCFYPQNTGIDYITVRGFELAQAASPWAPPTADQPGLIGAHWSKGWIIEDNIIHDAKCSAISIGKEILSGHNYRSIRRDKPVIFINWNPSLVQNDSGGQKKRLALISFVIIVFMIAVKWYCRSLRMCFSESTGIIFIILLQNGNFTVTKLAASSFMQLSMFKYITIAFTIVLLASGLTGRLKERALARTCSTIIIATFLLKSVTVLTWSITISWLLIIMF